MSARDEGDNPGAKKPPAVSSGPRIFINYRREDTGGYAGWLRSDLVAHFGAGHVFMDIDDIPPGEDFVRVIDEEVSKCDVFVAVIGREWATIADARGKRRLDNGADWVRLEIKTALERGGVRVIPALVDGAEMPGPEELPEDIKAFARCNAVSLRRDGWNHAVEKLIRAAELVGGNKAARIPAPSEAKTPAPAPKRSPQPATHSSHQASVSAKPATPKKAPPKKPTAKKPTAKKPAGAAKPSPQAQPVEAAPSSRTAELAKMLGLPQSPGAVAPGRTTLGPSRADRLGLSERPRTYLQEFLARRQQDTYNQLDALSKALFVGEPVRIAAQVAWGRTPQQFMPLNDVVAVTDRRILVSRSFIPGQASPVQETPFTSIESVLSPRLVEVRGGVLRRIQASWWVVTIKTTIIAQRVLTITSRDRQTAEAFVRNLPDRNPFRPPGPPFTPR